MKNKEEPSANSLRGNPSFSKETTGSLSRPGPTATAQTEQPALSDSIESLMERIVDEANVEAAWRNVKRNRGAPGPDGETIGEFFEQFRSRWPTIRNQLLDGTYEPSPVRRKVIDKPRWWQALARHSKRARPSDPSRHCTHPDPDLRSAFQRIELRVST